jgi:hypothetical protein
MGVYAEVLFGVISIGLVWAVYLCRDRPAQNRESCTVEDLGEWRIEPFAPDYNPPGECAETPPPLRWPCDEVPTEPSVSGQVIDAMISAIERYLANQARDHE